MDATTTWREGDTHGYAGDANDDFNWYNAIFWRLSVVPSLVNNDKVKSIELLETVDSFHRLGSSCPFSLY